MKRKYSDEEILADMQRRTEERRQLIQELRELIKPRWIPVEERLPENMENVLVTNASGTIYLMEYDSDFGFDGIDDTLAWMQLPEPYHPTESKSCWCGICEHATGDCPIEGEWQRCKRNFRIEQEQEA